MRGKRTSKINPWIIALIGFVPFYPVLAQMTPPTATLYGPMRPSNFAIAMILLKWLAFFLIPVAVIIGFVIYLVKKRRNSNDKQDSEIRKF